MRLTPWLFSVAAHGLGLGVIAGIGLAWTPGDPAHPTWIGLERRFAAEATELVPEQRAEPRVQEEPPGTVQTAEATPLPTPPDSALVEPVGDHAFDPPAPDKPLVDRNEHEPQASDAAWLVKTKRAPRPQDRTIQEAPKAPVPIDSEAFVPASELPGQNRPPEYPPAARRLGQAGTVVLVLEIGVTGAVLEANVLVSSNHPLLDAAALRAIRGWRYTPAMRAGKPVASELLQPVVFDLTSERAKPDR